MNALALHALASITRGLVLCLLSSAALAATPDGVVAVSHPAAAAAGARMLAQGGNAIEEDAPFMQPRFSIAAQDDLRKRGYIGLGDPGTEGCKETIGSVQAVVIDLATSAHHGTADPRREGAVIQVKP